MRRTLETAYHTFKEHPNFNQMQVVLNPDIREKITITGDVPLANADYLTELKVVY
jgi:hypothetical protein